jgi:chorismate mutase
MDDLRSIYFDDIDQSKPLVIAGPCSAETEDQVMETARELASFGFKIFRAGIWKPRTKPGGFEGVGEIGLEWLKRVKAETGMYTATEVATKLHVEQAVAAGVDMLWIGARTSANPFAMQEIADTLKRLDVDATVLVKNPVNPDLELWIGALQRIYNAGIRKLGAIHRGFSTYGKHLYRNVPQWRIPIELRRRYPNLPILCDPSHIGGKRELVAPIAQQALDMSFNGFIIESHCDPECALSDKAQQVTPDVLNYIIHMLVLRNESHTTEGLDLLRQQIDAIDDELVELLNKRMRVAREIGRFKQEHRMPVVQPGRYSDLMQKRVDAAVTVGMSAEFMRSVLAAIHEESVNQQIEVVNGIRND